MCSCSSFVGELLSSSNSLVRRNRPRVELLFVGELLSSSNSSSEGICLGDLWRIGNREEPDKNVNSWPCRSRNPCPIFVAMSSSSRCRRFQQHTASTFEVIRRKLAKIWTIWCERIECCRATVNTVLFVLSRSHLCTYDTFSSSLALTSSYDTFSLSLAEASLALGS